MASKRDIVEEQIRMLKLRILVDRTAFRLRMLDMDRSQALELIDRTKALVLDMCPGKETVYELVLRPRFMRVLDERTWSQWGVADAMN